ncbi:hypothetical protein Acsp01_91010 [Actinoplanes sp. NBRC 101535]|nr:hypothetical protein Acsp01_91010 [Actinoplanes sp. NBRC 101535]
MHPIGEPPQQSRTGITAGTTPDSNHTKPPTMHSSLDRSMIDSDTTDRTVIDPDHHQPTRRPQRRR